MAGWLLVIALVVLLAVEAAYLAFSVIPSQAGQQWLAMDFDFYRSVGGQWLADGSYYLQRQTEGPYVATLLGTGTPVDILYPPSALLLFVPFTYLPAALWWIIPTSLLAWCVASWKPAPLTLAVSVALLLWPRAIGAWLFGNSDIWVVAAIASGLRFGWPAIFLTIKPTFAPLALVGIRSRPWWIVAAAMLATVVVALPLWSDYVTAMRYVSIPLWYSLGSLPLMAVPVVAWARRPRDTPGTGVPASRA
jgi:hypothetical protein